MMVFADSYPAEIKGVFTFGGMSDLDDVVFVYEGVDGFAYRGTPASSSHLDLPVVWYAIFASVAYILIISNLP